MVLNFLPVLLKRKIHEKCPLASLKTLTNYKDCSERHIKCWCRHSFSLISRFSALYIHGQLSEQLAAFGTTLRVTGRYWKSGTTLQKVRRREPRARICKRLRAQEPIPRNRFRQPMQPGGPPVRQIGFSHRPARPGIDSLAPFLTRFTNTGSGVLAKSGLQVHAKQLCEEV